MSKNKIVLPQPQGYAAPGFEDVRRAFQAGFTNGVEKGASIAVYYKGSLTVNLWGGLADEQVKRPWKEDDFGYFYSVSKFLTTLVIADLVEKRLLNYEDKISKHWPEFAQNGKDGITLTMLLTHTSGLPFLDEDYEIRWMQDKPALLTELLVKQRPLWEPGKEVAYSLVLVGAYINEIVKRVDPKRRNVSQYFHDEIAVPYSLDIHIGLPKCLHYRTPRFVWKKYTKEDLKKMIADSAGDFDLYLKSLRQPSDWNSRSKLNDPDFANLPSPSSHAIGTAKAMAKLAGILSNGGKYEGKTLLMQKTIDELQKPKECKTDYISSDNGTYGLGTMLFPLRQGDKTWFVFGHTGFGGQVVLADSHKNFGFAYCTNYTTAFTSINEKKWKPVVDALYACIQKLEGMSDTVRIFSIYHDFLRDLKDNPVNSKL